MYFYYIIIVRNDCFNITHKNWEVQYICLKKQVYYATEVHFSVFCLSDI
jgi:hypothetical protein